MELMEVPFRTQLLRVHKASALSLIFVIFKSAASASDGIPMPDLAGMTSAQAFHALTAAGFTGPVSVVDGTTSAAVVSPGVTTDIVVWQSIYRGTPTAAGDSIQFKVETLCTVPDLELMEDGSPMPVAVAVDRATRAGRFQLKKMDPTNTTVMTALDPTIDYNGTIKAGSQKPVKGTKLPPADVIGAIININPSTAPPNPWTYFGIGVAVGAGAAAAGIALSSSGKKEEHGTPG